MTGAGYALRRQTLRPDTFTVSQLRDCYIEFRILNASVSEASTAAKPRSKPGGSYMLQLDIQPALIDQVHDQLLGAIADGTLAVRAAADAGERGGDAGRVAPARQSRPAGAQAARVPDRARQARAAGCAARRSPHSRALPGARGAGRAGGAAGGSARASPARRRRAERGAAEAALAAGREARRTHAAVAADRCRCRLPLGDPYAFRQSRHRRDRRRPVAAFQALHGAGAVGFGRACALLGRARGDPRSHSRRRRAERRKNAHAVIRPPPEKRPRCVSTQNINKHRPMRNDVRPGGSDTNQGGRP